MFTIVASGLLGSSNKIIPAGWPCITVPGYCLSPIISRRMGSAMTSKYFAALVCMGLVSGQAMAAENVTVISYGGASKEAQVHAFYKPFEQATGKKIVAGEWNGEMAKLKAMVSTNSVSWDVLDVEDTDLARGCDDGLFEQLDYERLGIKEKLVDGA